MARLPHARARLALACLIGAGLGAAPAVAAPEAPPAPDAFVILDQARSQVDAVSVDLAQVRSRMRDASPAALARLEARERVLLARKRSLMQHRDTAAIDAVQLREARERARRAREARERREAVEAAARQAEQAQRDAAAQAALAATGGDVVPGYRTLVNPGLAVAVSPFPGLAPGGDISAYLDTYLGAKLSPLAGLGASFVTEANAVGLDPRLLVAIAGAETSFGTYGPSQTIHNPFGLGPGRDYPSWQAAIQAAARNLAGPLYLGRGATTIVQIQQIWAPQGASNDPTNLNSNWVRNVSRYYAELGGNPTASVFSPTASTVASPAQAGVQAQTELGTPAAAATGTTTGSGAGPAVAQDALAFLGLPYRWGGTSPETGFDCSGLVQYLYARRGVTLPRVAEAQAAVGTAVAPEALLPGDAVFFADDTGYIHHEGLYLGGGMFVHAPSTGDVIKVSSMYEDYYARQYAGARRY